MANHLVGDILAQNVLFACSNLFLLSSEVAKLIRIAPVYVYVC